MEMAEINEVTRKIIGCAIEVHQALGPGQYEYTYASALNVAFQENGIRHEWEPTVPVRYKQRVIGSLRPDFIVEDAVILELKRCEWLKDESRAQILGYLRATSKKVGLLINFRTHPLKKGIERFILDERTSNG
jgi:GxxExxY protein